MARFLPAFRVVALICGLAVIGQLPASAHRVVAPGAPAPCECCTGVDGNACDGGCCPSAQRCPCAPPAPAVVVSLPPDVLNVVPAALWMGVVTALEQQHTLRSDPPPTPPPIGA